MRLVLLAVALCSCAAIDDALGGPARPYQHDPWAADHPDVAPLYEVRDAGARATSDVDLARDVVRAAGGDV